MLSKFLCIHVSFVNKNYSFLSFLATLDTLDTLVATSLMINLNFLMNLKLDFSCQKYDITYDVINNNKYSKSQIRIDNKLVISRYVFKQQ